MILRPYQSLAIDQFRTKYRDGIMRLLYQAPTGSGKTVTFSFLALATSAKGNSVCILVHRRELLRQASRSLTECGVEHNIIAPGHAFGDALVTVASKDTLRRRDGHKFDLLVIDEAHHTPASTYQTIIDMARWVLGVTATPCRLSGRGLGTVFESLICGPTIKELTPEYLSPYVLYAPPCPVDMKGIKSEYGDYNKQALADAFDRPSIIGDAVQHYRQHLDGKPAIAFCFSVEHAIHTARIFQEAGYAAAHVDGTLDDDLRDDRIASLGDGRLSVLTSCALIDEGLDVPGVEGIIDLRPTRSLSRCMQAWGRALRIAPGKQRAVILDHTGNVWRHGMPDENRDWSLTEGIVKPPKPAEIAERIRQCPECYYTHEYAPECPACGYRYKVKKKRAPSYIEGVLKEVTLTDEVFNELRIKAKTFADLAKLGKAKGYKPGWAYAQAKRKHIWVPGNNRRSK